MGGRGRGRGRGRRGGRHATPTKAGPEDPPPAEEEAVGVVSGADDAVLPKSPPGAAEVDVSSVDGVLKEPELEVEQKENVEPESEIKVETESEIKVETEGEIKVEPEVDPAEVVPGEKEVSEIDPAEVVPGEKEVNEVDPAEVVPGEKEVSEVDPAEVVPGEKEVSEVDPAEVVPTEEQVKEIDAAEVMATEKQVNEEENGEAVGDLKLSNVGDLDQNDEPMPLQAEDVMQNADEQVEEMEIQVEEGVAKEEDGTAEGEGRVDAPSVELDEQMEIAEMAQKTKLRKEMEIFVGGLDRDANEEDIKKAFETVGEVVNVRLHKDFVTNKNKGFAFVTFAAKEQVARALSEMERPLIRGKRCGVAPCEDNDTLFLGNICNSWTKEAVKQKLQEYGINTVVKITLVPDTQNLGMSRGFAFLEFPSHREAMNAYKRLQKPDVVFGHLDRTAKVAFAEPLREADAETMSQVKSVFIDGLPQYWDEDRMKELLKGYGEIERVALARNMPSAKRKDFGFVNFATHEAAVACVEAINNTEIGDEGQPKVKVVARLANPLPKTQAVKGGLSGGFRIGYPGAGFNQFGRRFVRGRHSQPQHRGGFEGGRFSGQFRSSRGGRFPVNNSFGASSSDFRGRRPLGFRGGRWSSPGSHGYVARGQGRGGYPPRMPPSAYDGHYSEPYGEDPYYAGDNARGYKRPFSAMAHESDYFPPGPTQRPRFDNPDPRFGGSQYGMEGPYPPDYHGSYGMDAPPYPQDYHGFDYGGRGYSSFPRGRGRYY